MRLVHTEVGLTTGYYVDHRDFDVDLKGTADSTIGVGGSIAVLQRDGTVVGVGTTAKDFYSRTRQYENFRSIGVGTHSFNYSPIKVTVEGIVGISSIEGKLNACTDFLIYSN